MKNNTVILSSIAFLIIGLFAGKYLLNGQFMNHRMSDGSRMNNPMDMQGAMNHMAQELDNKTGEEFDKAFLSEMIVHHEGAIVMAEQALKNTKNPEILKLANEIIAAQTKEISMMKSWQK